MDSGQLSIFDETSGRVTSSQEQDPLRNLAFLYTATEKGNNSGIRFMMTLDDAVAFCESPKSKGVLHGTRWAYFFTSVYNYINAHADYGENIHPNSTFRRGVLHLKGIADDKGTYDWLIAELGLKKIQISQIPHVLRPLGVTVVV